MEIRYRAHVTVPATPCICCCTALAIEESKFAKVTEGRAVRSYRKTLHVTSLNEHYCHHSHQLLNHTQIACTHDQKWPHHSSTALSLIPLSVSKANEQQALLQFINFNQPWLMKWFLDDAPCLVVNQIEGRGCSVTRDLVKWKTCCQLEKSYSVTCLACMGTADMLQPAISKNI